MLYVLWTGIHVETQTGFTVPCLIKQRKDWPNRFDEQPCWCCVLSTNMTLLVSLSVQRTGSTFVISSGLVTSTERAGPDCVIAQYIVGSITAVINAYVY